MKLWNFRGEQNSITDALHLKIPEHAVISITGAGGKTSLIFAWAREFLAAGKSVAVTTATHMYSPERMKEEPFDLYRGIPVVLCPAGSSLTDHQSGNFDENCSTAAHLKQRIIRALEETGIVLAVSPDPEKPGKVAAPTDEILEFLYNTADVTLVEADGSRRMPLKWPADYEPAVPDITDITVCVAGLSALGRNPEDVIYGFRYLPTDFLIGSNAKTDHCKSPYFSTEHRESDGLTTASSHVPDGRHFSSLQYAYPAHEIPESGSLEQAVVDEKLINHILISNEGGQKGTRGELRFFLNQADDERLQKSAAKIQMMLAVCGMESAWGTLLPYQGTEAAAQP